jgi:hypothetical protein
MYKNKIKICKTLKNPKEFILIKLDLANDTKNLSRQKSTNFFNINIIINKIKSI